MKFAICRIDSGPIPFGLFLPEEGRDHLLSNFIGYVELSIEKPKKLVTKETKNYSLDHPVANGYGYPTFAVPENAKNIKCTYEVEE